MTKERTRLAPTDWVVASYCVLVMALILFARSRVPNWPLYVAAHGAVVGAVLLVALWRARSGSRVVRIVRDFDLLVYVPVLFFMTTVLVHRVHPVDYDRDLISIDRAIGGIAVLKWMETISRPFLTDAAKILWVIYYSVPLLLGIPLYLRKPRSAFQEGKLLFALNFLVCYVGYFALPAEGPGYYAEEIGVAQPKWEESAVSLEIKKGIDVMEGRARDTFPSGHVMTAAMAIFVCLRNRLWKTALLLVPLSLGIIGSTLYLRYHYLVDGIVGLALVGLIAVVGIRWQRASRRPASDAN